jgi:hypothetical protein
MFRLKSLDPARYRENSTVDVTSAGKPIPSFVFLMPDGSKKTAEDMRDSGK